MLCIKFVKFLSNGFRECVCYALDSCSTQKCQTFEDRPMGDEQHMIRKALLNLYKNIIWIINWKEFFNGDRNKRSQAFI